MNLDEFWSMTEQEREEAFKANPDKWDAETKSLIYEFIDSRPNKEKRKRYGVQQYNLECKLSYCPDNKARAELAFKELGKLSLKLNGALKKLAKLTKELRNV